MTPHTPTSTLFPYTTLFRSYVTGPASDDERMTVRFGDGTRGARLPTGTENVTAEYRTGIGRAGVVDAGRITLLATRPLRSEEHTSELQSHVNLVCRLLLEKK